MLILFNGGAPDLKDWEFKYGVNGYTLNGQSALPFVDVDSVDGLDSPDIRVIEADRDGEHGGYSYAKFYNRRIVTFDLMIFTDTESYLDLLKTNFQPKDEGDWLFWKPPDKDIRLLYCKPIKFRYEISRKRSASQMVQAQLLFEADDPRWYGATTNSVVLYPTLIQQGRVYPKAYPYTYGANQVGGHISVFNSGSLDSDPTFALTGPVSHPTVFNQTTGQTMFLDVDLNSSQSLFVDVPNKFITLNGNPAADVFRVGSDWVTITRGNNELFFSCVSSHPPASVVVSSRDAWI